MKNIKNTNRFVKGLKRNIVFVILIFAAYNSYGQLCTYLNDMNSNTNFFTIQQEMHDYLDSLKTTMDSSEFYAGSGEYKEFKRFEQMWEPRVSPHGSFSEYYDNQYDCFANKSYSTFTNAPWRELGPNRVQTSGGKGIGPVEFLTFFDNGTAASTQYMLTGSVCGGLFYSTDSTGTVHVLMTGLSPDVAGQYSIQMTTKHGMHQVVVITPII